MYIDIEQPILRHTSTPIENMLERTRPDGKVKRRARDILIGALDLFLTRNWMDKVW
jgi:hypothetical protein